MSLFKLDELKKKPNSFPCDFDHENGNYLRVCVDCGEEFIGYKRRLVCAVCERNKMNEDYEKLPAELKVLADRYKAPYDCNYDYIKDMDTFIDYEKEVNGLCGLHISSYLTEDSNNVAYCFLKIHYSPNIKKEDFTGGIL